MNGHLVDLPARSVEQNTERFSCTCVSVVLCTAPGDTLFRLDDFRGCGTRICAPHYSLNCHSTWCSHVCIQWCTHFVALSPSREREAFLICNTPRVANVAADSLARYTRTSITSWPSNCLLQRAISCCFCSCHFFYINVCASWKIYKALSQIERPRTCPVVTDVKRWKLLISLSSDAVGARATFSSLAVETRRFIVERERRAAHKLYILCIPHGGRAQALWSEDGQCTNWCSFCHCSRSDSLSRWYSFEGCARSRHFW